MHDDWTWRTTAAIPVNRHVPCNNTVANSVRTAWFATTLSLDATDLPPSARRDVRAPP